MAECRLPGIFDHRFGLQKGDPERGAIGENYWSSPDSLLDMVRKHGFAPLGAADGAVKSAIFGYNSVRVYKLGLRAELPLITRDKMTAAEQSHCMRRTRSNLAYGYIQRRT